MPVHVLAYKAVPLLLKAASWRFRRSPKLLLLLWLLPLLKQPAHQRRRAARLQLLETLFARHPLYRRVQAMSKPLGAAAPYLRTWYENGRRARR